MTTKRFSIGKTVFFLLAALVVGGMATFIATFPDFRALIHETPNETAFIRLRAREAAAQGRQSDRIQVVVPLSAISPHLRHAVLVAEDSGFYRHDGVDWEAIKSAAREDLKRRSWTRGGSTITQQLVKNLYLSPSRNPLRKLHEILLAVAMERVLSKGRILELYLNLVEWGPGIYGAEAASRTYFHHSAATLDPTEAATLAGMLINPRRYAPDRRSPRLARRRAIILSRMFHAGYITEQDYHAATEPPGGLTDLLKRLFEGKENPPLEEEGADETETPVPLEENRPSPSLDSPP